MKKRARSTLEGAPSDLGNSAAEAAAAADSPACMLQSRSEGCEQRAFAEWWADEQSTSAVVIAWAA